MAVVTQPKFFSIISRSGSNSYLNTEFNPFDSTKYSSHSFDTVSDEQSGFSYTSGSGEITVTTSGFYHIIYSGYFNTTASGDSSPFVRFKKNSSEFFGTNFGFNLTRMGSGGGEKTFQAVHQFNDNDVLTITVSSNDATDSIFAASGTSLTLVEVGDFAVGTRIAGTSEIVSIEHNPFLSGTQNTDYLAQASDKFSISGSNATDRSFQTSFDSATPVFTIANFKLEDADATAHTVTYKILKNTSTTAMSISQVASPATVQPDEITIGGMQSLTNGDTISAVANFDDGDGAYAFSGSAHSIVSVNPEAYISLYTPSTSSNINTGSVVNLFKNASPFTSYSTSDLITAVSATYSSGSGTFTVEKDGYYHLYFSNILVSVANDATQTYTVRKNATDCSDGTVIYQSTARGHSGVSPSERTINGIFQLSASDTISICMLNTGIGAANSAVQTRSSFLTLYKVSTDYQGGGGGGGYAEEPGVPLYDSEYVIQTYSKSNQHLRYTEQVPFGIQVPGPLSLRMRSNPTIKK
jgi:hypothetical protein